MPLCDEVQSSAVALRAGRSGLTLLELTVVLVVMVALAGVMIPLVGTESARARDDATRSTLTALRAAVIQYWNDRVLTDDSVAPVLQEAKRLLHVLDENGPPVRDDTPQLAFLMFNPVTLDRTYSFDPQYRVGWRGPYMREATGSYGVNVPNGFTTRYGLDGDPAFLDAWGQPIVIQHPGVINGVQDVRLVSAGGNGVLDTDPTVLTDNLLSTGDDVYVSFQLR